MYPRMFDFLIVGAGFAGCTLANCIATHLDRKVLLIDTRNHIGGNAFDFYDNAGVLIHKYGAHIFHTNSKKIIDYLSQFTQWRVYQHEVLAKVDGDLYPIPINLNTINKLYGLNLNSQEIKDFYEQVKEKYDRIENSEQAVVGKVGTDLYEKFFKNYTYKQWDLWPHELDASVCARIPVRTNKDNRYFGDKYQLMPLNGYTKMFEKMLANPNIKVMLNTSFQDVEKWLKFDHLIYTGPIDQFFDYKFGKLPYRSLRFEFETHDVEYFQPVAVVNYPNDYDFTRIVESKHITGQKHPKTTIYYEYPQAEGDPYYPVPRPENRELFQQYKTEADKLETVTFVGRLAQYQYYNMDQVVAAALTVFENRISQIY
ncbi:UDP-galactopyranose mutase [Anabaena sp. UHCC 0451]|uniref:UDP-galactopyranose mutase n=1 Tax=Anabaena sp. UHCC 0451 TaxID=2055235 RepID=UPI002B1EC73E|nr:UDP-galactopyranose mutase [Anabaena sp. UHCC 0451]MEA5577528.1 UDP-galactopyranose mutase [Anabaena sp. UHCC 0451]